MQGGDDSSSDTSSDSGEDDEELERAAALADFAQVVSTPRDYDGVLQCVQRLRRAGVGVELHELRESFSANFPLTEGTLLPRYCHATRIRMRVAFCPPPLSCRPAAPSPVATPPHSFHSPS
jgi:hypothetical protein